jgi:hypothetical protein
MGNPHTTIPFSGIEYVVSGTGMVVQDVLNDRPDLLVGHLKPSYLRIAKDQPVQEFGLYVRQ